MKKIIFILCAATIAAITGGCTKFLDTVPDNRTKIDNIDKIKALLVSAYPDRTYAMLLEARCDGFMDYGMTFEGLQPEADMDCTYTAFRWDEYSKSEAGNDTNDGYWLSCYSAIAHANHALEALDKLEYKEEYAPYKAEAFLCRAYCHFMLLTLYANMFDEPNQGSNLGIPYVTEPETVVIKKYDRETVSATLAKIKADLDEGLKNVGSSAAYAQPKFHFTRNSALAFAARFALYTGDYPAVVNYVNALIPLVTEHTKLPGKNADGSAIEVPSVSDLAAVYTRTNLYDWEYAAAAYTSVDAWGKAFSLPKNSNNLLSSEVVSLASLANQGSAWLRYALSPDASLALFMNNPTGKNWVMPAISYTGDKSTWVAKFFTDVRYINITAGVGIFYTKIGLFRLEEMLLARAEAFTMMGQYTKALDDLNLFMQKRIDGFNPTKTILSKDVVNEYYASDIADSKSFLNSSFNSDRFSAAATTAEGKLQRALLMTCLDFRHVEFIFEGMRWFDILRWHIPVTHTLLTGETSTLTGDDDRRMIQLPQTTALSDVEPNPMNNIPFPW